MTPQSCSQGRRKRGVAQAGASRSKTSAPSRTQPWTFEASVSIHQTISTAARKLSPRTTSSKIALPHRRIMIPNWTLTSSSAPSITTAQTIRLKT